MKGKKSNEEKVRKTAIISVKEQIVSYPQESNSKDKCAEGEAFS